MSTRSRHRLQYWWRHVDEMPGQKVDCTRQRRQMAHSNSCGTSASAVSASPISTQVIALDSIDPSNIPFAPFA